MAKGGNGTRSVNASSAALGRTTESIKGYSRSVTFPKDTKLSDFDGQFFGNGGDFTLNLSNGAQMSISTTNGYNEEYGANGTLIYTSLKVGKEERQVDTFFMENTNIQLANRGRLTDNDGITRSINERMPYLIEVANNYLLLYKNK